MPTTGAMTDRRPSYSVVSAFAGTAGLAAVVAMSVACGSIECTETATCPDLATDATEAAEDAASTVDAGEDVSNAVQDGGGFDASADGATETSDDSGIDVDAGGVPDATGNGPDGCAPTEDCTNGIDD